jgi:hypothetical protein
MPAALIVTCMTTDPGVAAAAMLLSAMPSELAMISSMDFNKAASKSTTSA